MCLLLMLQVLDVQPGYVNDSQVAQVPAVPLSMGVIHVSRLDITKILCVYVLESCDRCISDMVLIEFVLHTHYGTAGVTRAESSPGGTTS